MKADKKWIDLGWRHPLWNIIRLYTPLGQTNAVNEWDYNLKKRGLIEIDNDQKLTLSKNQIDLFYEYIEEREKLFKIALIIYVLRRRLLIFARRMALKSGRLKQEICSITSPPNPWLQLFHQSPKSFV